MFLKISQNSWENTCARISFLINMQTWGLATLLKNRKWRRCFPVNFAKFLGIPILKNISERLVLENNLEMSISSVIKTKIALWRFFQHLYLKRMYSIKDLCYLFSLSILQLLWIFVKKFIRKKRLYNFLTNVIFRNYLFV